MEKTADSASKNKDKMECASTIIEDFISSGRTGRRNAMADIMDPKKASVSTGGLAFDMEKLNCSDNSQKQTKPASNTSSSSSGS